MLQTYTTVQVEGHGEETNNDCIIPVLNPYLLQPQTGYQWVQIYTMDIPAVSQKKVHCMYRHSCNSNYAVTALNKKQNMSFGTR